MDRMGGVGSTIQLRQDPGTKVGSTTPLSRTEPAAVLEEGGVSQVRPQTVPSGGGAARTVGERISGFFQRLGEGIAQVGRGIRDLFQGVFRSAGPTGTAGTTDTGGTTGTGGTAGPSTTTAAPRTVARTVGDINADLGHAARARDRGAVDTLLREAAALARPGVRQGEVYDPSSLPSFMGEAGVHLSDDDFEFVAVVAKATAQDYAAGPAQARFMTFVGNLGAPSARALDDLEANLRTAEDSTANPLGSFMRGNSDYSAYTGGVMMASGRANGIAQGSVQAARTALSGEIAGHRDTPTHECGWASATPATTPVILGGAREMFRALFTDTGPGSARNLLSPEAAQHLADASRAVLASSLSAEDKTTVLNTLFSDAVFLRSTVTAMSTEGVKGLAGSEKALVMSSVKVVQSVANGVEESRSKMSPALAGDYAEFYKEIRPELERFFVQIGRPTNEQIRNSVG